MANFHDLDGFTRSYIETALWSSMDDGDAPLDSNYGPEDLAPETLAQMIEDCKAFQADYAEWLTEDHYLGAGWTALEFAGHDFWLTRNGHGSGFWDGCWTEEAGKQLTEASKAYGSVDLYVGDDNLIYC